MYRSALAVLASVLAVATATAAAPSSAGAAPNTTVTTHTAATVTAAGDFVVLYPSAGTSAAARRAIALAGGKVVSENTVIGYAVVRSTRSSFAAEVSKSSAVVGAVRDRVIGYAPQGQQRNKFADEDLSKEAPKRAGTTTADPAPAPSAEPLSNRQWDMRQIGATPTGSYRVQPGVKTVKVGIIDTGIDGSHPDIAPNFDAAESHNFVVDNPVIDGPCEYPSCVDPVDHDDNQHGTHVASTIGSPINGTGIAGVAPNVTLVNLRAGQDSGYFFLQPTLEAITYAGDIGVDVVNMSFYTDPWLFNCVDNPADSAAERTEQRVVREVTQRALDYVRKHGVLPIAAMGNDATDLGNPTTDTASPDFPADAARTRTINNSCITVPAESRGVVAVSATGPSTRMSYYSNYGTEQTDVSAPGGDAYDSPDGTLNVRNEVLAAYPKNVAVANGDLNDDGTPKTESVVRDCNGDVCAYYKYLQGTSMATPHAVGVAALIVSQYGRKDAKHGGLTLDPKVTEQKLLGTAVDHACPQPREFTWTRIRPTGEVLTSTATCTGPTFDNGFYGQGIVNAYTAVTGKK